MRHQIIRARLDWAGLTLSLSELGESRQVEASGQQPAILEFRQRAAGLGKSGQVWASGRQPTILEFRLLAAGLSKSKQF